MQNIQAIFLGLFPLFYFYYHLQQFVPPRRPLYPHVIVTPRFQETDTFSLVSTSFVPAASGYRAPPLPQVVDDVPMNGHFIARPTSEYFPIFNTLKLHAQISKCPSMGDIHNKYVSNSKPLNPAGPHSPASRGFPSPYGSPLVTPYLVVPLRHSQPR